MPPAGRSGLARARSRAGCCASPAWRTGWSGSARQAKEGGIEPLRPLFGKIAKAYLIGEAEAAFAETLGATPHARCGTLAEAVGAARAEARPGDVILLSPACASFDQFASFEARGEAFRELVATGLREEAGR